VTRTITFMISTLALLTVGAPAAAQVRALTDAELDRVTAGSARPATATPNTLPDEPIAFDFKSPAGTRHSVEGSGTVQVASQPVPVGASSIVIRDNAQQQLQSFINITAANALVQVLVNLNITINSTVGSVQQVNLSGAP
jgi:hypothetical protein